MSSRQDFPTPTDVTALILAVARNTEAGGLRKFLELHRWKALAEYLQPVEYVAWERVFSQGDVDRRLYFVERGELKVEMQTEKGVVSIGMAGAGSVVGEGSFFSHSQRIATVSANTDCKVWILTPEDFERLSVANSNVALAVSMALGTMLATRMQDLSKRVSVC